jgi:hypothetical protein
VFSRVGTTAVGLALVVSMLLVALAQPAALGMGDVKLTLDGRSDYLRASQARDVLESVRRDVEYAGIDVGSARAAGAWDDLEALVDDALRVLGVERAGPTFR